MLRYLSQTRHPYPLFRAHNTIRGPVCVLCPTGRLMPFELLRTTSHLCGQAPAPSRAGQAQNGAGCCCGCMSRLAKPTSKRGDCSSPAGAASRGAALHPAAYAAGVRHLTYRHQQAGTCAATKPTACQGRPACCVFADAPVVCGTCSLLQAQPAQGMVAAG